MTLEIIRTGPTTTGIRRQAQTEYILTLLAFRLMIFVRKAGDYLPAPLAENLNSLILNTPPKRQCLGLQAIRFLDLLAGVPLRVV